MRIRNEILFAIVPEWVIDHPSISDKALRLYAVLNRYANDDGRCNPSRKTLADRLGCSKRTIDRLIDELESEAVRAIEVERDETREDGTARNRYVVRQSPPEGATPVTPGGDIPDAPAQPVTPGGDTDDARGGDIPDDSNQSHSESDLPSEGATATQVSPSPRPRDAVWDGLVTWIGQQPETESERAKWNAAAAQIRRALEYSASEEDRYTDVRLEVRRRARRYDAKYSFAAKTPFALASHWGECGPPVDLVIPFAEPGDDEAEEVPAKCFLLGCEEIHADWPAMFEAHPEQTWSERKKARALA